eukprot:351853-Chlamydomonas_euryale.AAC.2
MAQAVTRRRTIGQEQERRDSTQPMAAWKTLESLGSFGRLLRVLVAWKTLESPIQSRRLGSLERCGTEVGLISWQTFLSDLLFRPLAGMTTPTRQGCSLPGLRCVRRSAQLCVVGRRVVCIVAARLDTKQHPGVLPPQTAMLTAAAAGTVMCFVAWLGAAGWDAA